jgi:hypothetical protein
LARSASICEATWSTPSALTPPHFGVQPPPEVMKARLNSFTPVWVTVFSRSYAG